MRQRGGGSEHQTAGFQWRSSTIITVSTYGFHFVSAEFADDGRLGVALHDVSQSVAAAADDGRDFGSI